MTKQDIIDEINGIKNDLEFPIGSENVVDYEDAVDDATLRLEDLSDRIEAEYDEG